MTEVSARVVAQRLRNNIMRMLAEIARGDAAVRDAGFQDYFENVFDEVPYDGACSNEAVISEEASALASFLASFRQACDATPRTMTEEAFVRTGWPAKLAPVATEALAVFARRGFLSDEEIDPR